MLFPLFDRKFQMALSTFVKLHSRGFRTQPRHLFQQLFWCKNYTNRRKILKYGEGRKKQSRWISAGKIIIWNFKRKKIKYIKLVSNFSYVYDLIYLVWHCRILMFILLTKSNKKLINLQDKMQSWRTIKKNLKLSRWFDWKN